MSTTAPSPSEQIEPIKSIREESPAQKRAKEILLKVKRPFVFDGNDLNRHELYTLIEALARSCDTRWTDLEVSELLKYTSITTAYIDGTGNLLIAYDSGTTLPGRAAATIKCQTRAENDSYENDYRNWGPLCSAEFEKNATSAGGLLVLKSPHRTNLQIIQEPRQLEDEKTKV